MNSSLRWVVRVVVACVLIAVGMLSLPLVALVFDEAGQEGWIIPVQVVVMALFGALVGYVVPVFGAEGATRTRSALWGVGVALVGVVLSLVWFFTLLNGLGGL